MTEDIVMLHGANVGAWCFERFRAAFEDLGWTCHAPDLPGHGEQRIADAELAKLGMSDYRAALSNCLDTFARPPVVLGHSMGAVLAQQLAAEDKARALVLVSPAPRAGIPPLSDNEQGFDKLLMGIGSFWTGVINPVFDLACHYSLNCIPAEEQRAVFDRFGPESGKALFELFFWMLDPTGATVVDTDAVRCPVLCLSGSEDHLVSPETTHETAAAYKGATLWELENCGHMLLLEPGAVAIANHIAGWIPEITRDPRSVL